MVDTCGRILLIGCTGQVGWELHRTLVPLGQVVTAARRGGSLSLDLTDLDSIRKVVREVCPNLIVNAAAYTAVDQAEEEPERAIAINGDAPGVLAEEARRLDAMIVHYSTDYVFDGTSEMPYTEEDEPNPINTYGRTKLAGERAVQAAGGPYLIFRTSWIYGLRGNNFLLTMLRLARARTELRVVNDQRGSPSWSRMVAEVTAQVLARTAYCSRHLEENSQIYHLTASGETSWYGFTKEILSRVNNRADYTVERLLAIATQEYPLPAARPRSSVLSCDKIQRVFGMCLPSWQSALALCMDVVPRA